MSGDVNVELYGATLSVFAKGNGRESEGRMRNSVVNVFLGGKRAEVLDVLGVVLSVVLVVRDVRYDRCSGVRAEKVGNESEACNAELRLGSVEFCNNIRGADSFADNDHRAIVARLGFAVEGLLEARVADEN